MKRAFRGESWKEELKLEKLFLKRLKKSLNGGRRYLIKVIVMILIYFTGILPRSFCVISFNPHNGHLLGARCC